jgi:hypothetical protein
MLVTSGENGIGVQDLDPMLSPHHLEAFLARAPESATKTRHFEREWQELYRLVRHGQLAWEKGQILFEADLMYATTNREEMEYLSMIDFADDCFATCVAHRGYPHNRTLDAWVISGYMLAWRQHFLVDNEPCSDQLLHFLGREVCDHGSVLGKEGPS